jgi:hypothetical protein
VKVPNQIFGIGRKQCHTAIHYKPGNSLLAPRNFETRCFLWAEVFHRCVGETGDGYRVCIQLNALDEDLLSGAFVNAKSRAIVRRAAILDFLPTGLNDDWPYTGYIFDQSVKTDWDTGVPPTVLRGHNVWIIDDPTCDQ